jgi:hypothetical protein
MGMVITTITATPTPAPIPAFTPVLPTDEGCAAADVDGCAVADADGCAIADADGCEGNGEEDETFEIVIHPSMLNWLTEELV